VSALGVRRTAFADTFDAVEVLTMRPEDRNARQFQRAFAEGAPFLRSLGAPDDAHPRIGVQDDYEVCVVQRSAPVLTAS
jgi:hypothetical protein